MEARIVEVLKECTSGSEAGRLSFPEVLGLLSAVGVERYRADLVRAEKTYYFANGESHVVPCAALTTPFAQEFAPDAIERAIRASQGKQIGYPEFCARAAAAGCVDYLVSLTGRRAVYVGRTGETHVEPFPVAR